MSKLQQIKDEVVKVYPSIMELSFGCEFLWQEDSDTKDRYKVIDIYFTEDIQTEIRGFSMKAINLSKDFSQKDVVSFDNPEDWKEEGLTFYDLSEILGHPITLEHILGAINIDMFIYSVDTLGQFWKWFTEDDEQEATGIVWTLTKPLSEQPPETIDFIHSLLFDK